jgi:hypothetical protein
MFPTLASRSIACHHKILHLIPKLVLDKNTIAQKGLEADLAYIAHCCFPRDIVYGSFEGKDKGAGRTAVLFVSYTPI